MRGEETGLFAERWRATHQSEAGAAEKSCAFDLAFVEYRQIGRQSANRKSYCLPAYLDLHFPQNRKAWPQNKISTTVKR